MFGNRYFGTRYFGDRYFGPVAGGAPPIDPWVLGLPVYEVEADARSVPSLADATSRNAVADRRTIEARAS